MPEYSVLSPSDQQWLTFVSAMPQATIFHHPSWIGLLAACYGYRPVIVAVRDSAGSLRAGLPLMQIASPLTGRRWVSLPYSDYCPPLYTDDDALQCLTDSLLHLSHETRIRRMELRWTYPARPGLQICPGYVLHTIPLHKDPKEVGRRFDSTHRQNIRMAKKKGVRIERGDQIEHIRAFYNLQLETRQRKGLPVQPWKYYHLLKTHLFDAGLGFTLLAYDGDQCVAGIVFLSWQQSLIAKYAASHADTLDLRPNNLLFWTGISWACENGYTTFDMGRTSLANTGLREFKNCWGADEVPLDYAISGAARRESEDGRLMRVLQTVIRHSPPWVCKTTGEMFYRHFG